MFSKKNADDDSGIPENDFASRAADVLMDACARMLQSKSSAEVNEFVEGLSSVENEAIAYEALTKSQKEDYGKIMTKISECRSLLSTIENNLPIAALTEIENIKRRKKSIEDMQKNLSILEKKDEIVAEPE